jgi:hypothetical protein
MYFAYWFDIELQVLVHWHVKSKFRAIFIMIDAPIPSNFCPTSAGYTPMKITHNQEITTPQINATLITNT